MNVLVINCGSSSLKFQLIDSTSENVIAKGLCERIGIEGSRLVYTPVVSGGSKVILEEAMPDHTKAVQMVLDALTNAEYGVVKSLSEIQAVGHRIVHGGEKFASSTLLTEEVIEGIKECSDLAPLHNPANLVGIEACRKLMPGVPMVGVFDTAFHQTMPEKAYLYGIPYSFYKKHKIRRYGFHGTSHKYVSQKAAELLNKPYDQCKIIVCHLGNGASVSAVSNGQCVDTSMGLTPLEGLIMGTRSGDMDPAIIEFIANKEGKSLEEIMKILNKESGVLGLSDGLSSDFRDLEEAYLKEGDVVGKRTLEAFCYRVAKYIGSYAVAMNGVDAICFTAGVGENSPIVRNIICENYLQFMGVEVDQELNGKRGQDLIISKNENGPKVLVIPTDEELMIARDTTELVK